MKLTPASYVAFVFGGYSAVARAIGVSRWEPYLWATKKRVHETGLVPSWHQRPLLEAAAAKGLDLTERDLIHGREIADALLVGRRVAPRLPAVPV